MPLAPFPSYNTMKTRVQARAITVLSDGKRQRVARPPVRPHCEAWVQACSHTQHTPSLAMASPTLIVWVRSRGVPLTDLISPVGICETRSQRAVGLSRPWMGMPC